LLAQNLDQLLQHPIHILENVIIPETNYSIAGSYQECSALRVDSLIVLTAVDFDNECRIPAQEIDDVRLDCYLPPKLPSLQLAGSKP
jgi:hypothetical protein